MIQVAIKTLIFSNSPATTILVLTAHDEPESVGVHRVIPIWMGASGGAALSAALGEAKYTRPMTHDLMLDALTNLDAVVDHALIYDVKESTFFAKLVLRSHGRLIELDARPSDALSLAIRQRAPIYMEESVYNRASFPYIVKKDSDEEDELKNFHEFLETLTPDDFDI